MFEKTFVLIETKISMYWKTNECGKVICFSQRIFRGAKLKCGKARF